MEMLLWKARWSRSRESTGCWSHYTWWQSGDEEAASEPGAEVFSARSGKVSGKSRWPDGERKVGWSRTQVLPRSRRAGWGGRVLEAAGKYKQTAPHLLAWGTDKWHKEVKFHLLEKVQESSEKVMGSKHSRSPWRIKGNLMTTSRRSRGWSEGWFHFCFC